MKIHKYLFASAIFTLTLIGLLFFTSRDTRAAGYGWITPSYSGSNFGCGAWGSPVTVVLRNAANGAAISGTIEAYIPGVGQRGPVNSSSLFVGCVDVRVGYWIHASVGGFHEAWRGPSAYDPASTHAQKNITDRFYLLPTSSGPSIAINSPSGGTWTNVNPDWVIYAVPSPGHSRIEAVGLFLWNFTTGTAPCNLCIWTGSWAAGAVNHGKLSIPDGWYAKGAQARDEIAGGTKGVTVWGEGKHHWSAGTDYSYFGLDRQPSTIVSTSHTPTAPFSTQTVNISARAQDQAGLSGVNWIQIRISTDNGATYGAPIQSPGYGGAFDSTFTITRGPWATGTRVCYQARAQDIAGNLSGWVGTRCFTVLAGADLVLESIDLNKSEYHVGESVNVTVTVRNIGQQNAGTFWIEICPSGSGPNINCPTSGTGTWQYRSRVTSLAGETPVSRTFFFPAPDPGVYPTTYTLVARADLPNPGLVTEEVEYNNNWALEDYIVIGPFPWFQTTGGDVGSCERIRPRIPPPVGFSADYLVIQQSDSSISNFTSARGWRIRDYDPLNIRPLDCPGPASMYDALLEQYEPTVAVSNNLVGLSGGVGIRSGPGTLAISGTGPVVYTGPPAVVFVPQQMNINTELHIGANTGIVFIVSDRVQINHTDEDGDRIRRVDGFFVVDGNFRTLSVGDNTEARLLISGGVLAGFNGGEFDLRRDFRSIDNRTIPTEIFNFEPKYLWLFRDIVGDKKTVWKEVAP